jgi:hypothetical protein
MVDSPIFILGAHKSGTSLLRSIFDGHPDLCVLPIETHCFPILSRWVRYPFQRTPAVSLTEEEVASRAIDWIRRSNVSHDPQADSIPAGIFDVERFSEHLRESLSRRNENSLDAREFISIYFESIAESADLESLQGNLRVVEKSVENAEFALDFSQMYPGAHFIHIIRNPYSNIVSLRNYKSQGSQFPYLGPSILAIYESYYFQHRNIHIIDKYKVIKYENLVSSPKEVVTGLCDFLNLEFCETLLKPTYMGDPWSGNSTTDSEFTGISSERLNDWKEHITALECALINKNLEHVVEKFYSKVEIPQRSVALPERGEYLATYLRNRALLYKYASSKASVLKFVRRNLTL